MISARLASLGAALLLASPAFATPPTVHKVKAERRDLGRTLSLHAVVTPRAWVELSPPSNGVIKAVQVDLADHVRHGQVLAILQGSSKTLVVAPIDGVVVARAAHLGSYVTAGGPPLFKIIDSESVRVVMAAPELDVPLLRVGQPVRFSFEAYPAMIYASKLQRIVPEIDTATRTLEVIAEVANPDGRLIVGLAGRASIELERRAGALVVPRAAVTREGEHAYVVRLDGSSARRVEVKVDAEEAGLIPVLAGVTESDVLLVGDGPIKDGSPVQVSP